MMGANSSCIPYGEGSGRKGRGGEWMEGEGRGGEGRGGEGREQRENWRGGGDSDVQLLVVSVV